MKNKYYQIKKILKILKNKKVNIYSLGLFKNAKRYNEFREQERKLNDYEYKELKEWLENEED